MLQDSLLNAILVREPPRNTWTTMSMTTLTMMSTIRMGAEGFILWGGAIGLFWGRLMPNQNRAGRKAEEDECNGGSKVGMPTLNDNDNGQALLGINWGLEGTVNVPRIIIPQWFAHPLPPALSNINIGLPQATQATQRPQSHVSPIIYAGEHDSGVHQASQSAGHHGSLPKPHPYPFHPILSPMA